MIFKTFWRTKSNNADNKTDSHYQIDSFKFKTTIETRFTDFDMMGHVNNAVYFTYMEMARTKYWQQAIKWDWKKTGVVIAKASLEYIKPVLPEDKLNMYVRTSKIGTSSFEMEYLMVKNKGAQEEICAYGKTVCVAFSYTNKTSTPIPDNERNKMRLFEQLSTD